VQVREGARADEEDVPRVDGDEIPPVPRLGDVHGDEDFAPLQQLEEGLLHALAANVPAPGPVARALRAAGNLVHLVDEDDAPLGVSTEWLALKSRSATITSTSLP
jgi:hypothetical protein